MDMYYMNKNKRNLIVAAAIVNVVYAAISLVLTILLKSNLAFFQQYYQYFMYFSFSGNIVSSVILFATSVVGSILLLYAVREKGKYYRVSSGAYFSGVIIVIFCGGFISWILLVAAAFQPNVIVMNDENELRKEYKQQQKEEILRDQQYEEKKAKIEELKRLRDCGAITEEEYKEKLFEML